ncbi:MAG: chemotaxis protein CheX [Thermoguttaceae bacterium]|jgi:chemotaxis protein CheX
MKVEYITPFMSSVTKVFQTMLACELTFGRPYVRDGVQPSRDVSGIIGLTGKARGTVVLSLEREAAICAAEALLGERPAGINSDVTDAIGELTNVVSGNAKAQLEQLALSVSLPTVITGKSHCIEFPRDIKPVVIPCHCKWGDVDLLVGLDERPSEAAESARR